MPTTAAYPTKLNSTSPCSALFVVEVGVGVDVAELRDEVGVSTEALVDGSAAVAAAVAVTLLKMLACKLCKLR